jgi:hypothetical protein
MLVEEEIPKKCISKYSGIPKSVGLNIVVISLKKWCPSGFHIPSHIQFAQGCCGPASSPENPQ